MLYVQTFLETHSLLELVSAHGVYARVSGHKFSLNYDQIECSNSDPLASQCRGLILRAYDCRTLSDTEIVGKTIVVARPMDRFFNYGMTDAAKIDFDDPSVSYFEKLDGTLCIVYWDDFTHEWCVATRSIVNADLPVDGFGSYTFRSLFEKALMDTSGLTFEEFVGCLSNANTYCFELTTPVNQVVVQHSDYRVWLLAVRDKFSGMEHPLCYFEGDHALGLPAGMCVPAAPRYVIRNFKDLQAFVETRKGTEHEGVVVCDKDFNRVKVKSAAYVIAHRAVSMVASSPRNMLDLILMEQMDDVLPILNDEKRAVAEKMMADLRTYMRVFDETWEKVRASVPTHLSDRVQRKEFAIAVQDAKLWMAPAMDRFVGKSSSLKEWISKQLKARKLPDGILDKILELISHNK